jgi:hypothetical protein
MPEKVNSQNDKPSSSSEEKIPPHSLWGNLGKSRWFVSLRAAISKLKRKKVNLLTDDAITPQIDDLSLPGERNTLQHLLRGKPKNLLYWFVAEFIFCHFLLWLLEQRPISGILKDYSLMILMGLLAVNGNIFFWLYISERCRRILEDPRNDHIFSDKPEAIKLWKDKIYRKPPLIISTLITLSLGILTIGKLGLSTPFKTSIVIWIALILCFFYLGRTIGFILNIWSFFINLGPRHLNIDPINEDRMGGIKLIGDLNSSILYLGGGLLAIYSFASYITPYARLDLKYIAYYWTYGAIILFNIGLLLPTVRIHFLLKDAKERQQQDLSRMKKQTLKTFEGLLAQDKPLEGEQVGNAKNLVESLKYFQDDIDKMVIWPYFNVFKISLKALSIQTIVPIIINWDKVKTLIASVSKATSS